MELAHVRDNDSYCSSTVFMHCVILMLAFCLRWTPLCTLFSTHINSKCSHPAPTYFCHSPAMGQKFSRSSLRSLTRSSAWVIEPEASTFAENSSWSNKDMDPVPPHKRTWTTFNYVTFWISCAVNITTWQLGSSMLVIGLSWYRLFCVTVCCSIPNRLHVGSRHY